MFEVLKKKLKELTEKILGKGVEAESRSEEEKKAEKDKRFFLTLKEGIIKRVIEKKLTREELEAILSDLEISLIEADVAYEIARNLKESLIKELDGKEVKRGREKEIVIEAIRRSLNEILDLPKISLEDEIRRKRPYLIVFFGFNGSGKTTTIAKVANLLIKKGFSCVLAAGDTFRAASIEQLEEHAKRIGVPIIKQKYGADPAAVIFDARKYAEAKKIDVVLADTAGRSYTNENLMEELKKIVRVNKPDLKVLVIDSLTGNDAVNQAKFFNEIGVDAVVFTKLDVNEKGGAILSVSYLLKKPILFVCDGQNYEDIKYFDKEEFLNNLLGF
ncbi:MAG: signal recognition particle-docking protein FtsY [Candidatus Aenigmarchaeota archaeon]|nr:signal recognition particle-docking protein FtsY [Candidatus Aenigmarchaeota archaeon]